MCTTNNGVYGSETWAVTKKMEHILKTKQHSMERTMLGISKRYRKTLQWIRHQTKVADIINQSEERNGGGFTRVCGDM